MQEGRLDSQEQTERLLAMGQMAASLAHEIRNPLGSMELFCSLLKRDLTEEPDKRHLAEQIHKGIKTLDRIISNCLQFSRDLSPKKTLCPDPHGLIEDSLEQAKAKTEQSGLRVEFEKTGRAKAYLDSYLLNQALLNLILNAIEACTEDNSEATEDSSQKSLVKIRSSIHDDQSWTVHVEDNGPGIPGEHLSKIFDPFFSTKRGGTGLGLAISHSIVRAHGGQLFLEAGPRGGTKATIILTNIDREETGR